MNNPATTVSANRPNLATDSDVYTYAVTTGYSYELPLVVLKVDAGSVLLIDEIDATVINISNIFVVIKGADGSEVFRILITPLQLVSLPTFLC